MHNEGFDPYSLEPDLLLQYKKTRRHFIERLKERLGIAIDIDEYDSLINHKPDFKHIYHLNNTTVFCSITINNNTVKCIYRSDVRAFKSGDKSFPDCEAKPRGFLTCITDDMATPTPYFLFHEHGITPQTMKKGFEAFEKKAKDISMELAEKGAKVFWTETNYDKLLKHSAKLALLGRPIPQDVVVRYYMKNADELLALQN